jgi:hypothetical protein
VWTEKIIRLIVQRFSKLMEELTATFLINFVAISGFKTSIVPHNFNLFLVNVRVIKTVSPKSSQTKMTVQIIC